MTARQEGYDGEKAGQRHGPCERGRTIKHCVEPYGVRHLAIFRCGFTTESGATELFGDIVCVRGEEWQYSLWGEDEPRYGTLSECVQWSLEDARFLENEGK